MVDVIYTAIFSMEEEMESSIGASHESLQAPGTTCTAIFSLAERIQVRHVIMSIMSQMAISQSDQVRFGKPRLTENASNRPRIIATPGAGLVGTRV
jgi:hypothetical protein